MLARPFRLWPGFLILGGGLLLLPALRGQDAAPDDAAAQPPPVPKGIEVLARGPVHEAFASLTAEPQPTKAVPKKPPKPLQEMPPDEKPEGNSIWIGGYWAWDDDRSDFLWVSGIWRTPPPGKQWVAGYWRDQDDGAQWVPGFWAPIPTQEATPQDVTYYPKPPDPPAIAAPGTAPSADTFYVPGHWEWNGADYAWRAGFWARVQPNYVWIPSHYSWTPAGYIYVAGYWDYSVKRRGVLYAPVFVDANVVDASYVYTPAYAVDDTLVVDALFVRPCTGHYYFGDYYDDSYRDAGFTSCVVYSRSNYDSIVVYERYEHREDPDWINVQVNLYNDRVAGRAPVPPRTLDQQLTVVNNTTVVNNINNTNVNSTNVNSTNVNSTTNNVTVNRQVMKTAMLAPPAKVMAANGAKVVKLDSATRQQVQQQAAAVQQVSVQRTRSEVAAPGGPPKQPHVASLNVPSPHPVAPKTVAAPAAQVARPPVAQNPKPGPAATPPANTVVNTRPAPAAPPQAPTKPTLPPVAPATLTTPAPPPAMTPNPPPRFTPPPLMRPNPPANPTVPGQPTTPAHPPTTLAPPPPPKRPPPPPPPQKDKDKDKQN